MSDLSAVTILVPGKMNPDTLDTLKATFDVEHLAGRKLEDLSEERRQAIRGIAQMGQVPAAMIDAAADMMQELLADPSRRPSDRRLASRLVIRGSARPPRSHSNMENVA